MSLNEQDLERIDSYLDGEMPSADCAAFESRLNGDASLLESLNEARAARDVRSQVFASMEPDALSMQRVMVAVRRNLTREAVWARRARTLRSLSAVAAIFVVGVFGGYMFRGGPATGVPQAPSPVTSADPNDGKIVFSPGNRISNLPVPHSNDLGNNQLVGYQVQLTDEAGNVLGTQRFRTLQEAEAFRHDILLAQKQNKQLQNGGIRLVADKF